MNKYIFAFIVCIMVTLASCHDNSTNPDGTTSKQVMPLRIGNLWIYAVTNYDSNNNVTTVFIDTVKIIKDTAFGIEKWYVSRTNSDPPFFETNRSDGLYMMFRDSIGGMSPVIFYKFPISAGNQYVRNFFFFQDTVKLISTSTSVTTDAGTFSTYQYQDIIQTFTYGIIFYQRADDYVDPAVGLIKSETYKKKANGTEYLSHLSKLKSYTLN